ncbi:SRPBCC family protein [Nocardia pseudobrasiliensis]|uniref:Polyketide cyclase/dehydrase/lipid transport protein n=1 Tax=Nocardia pseudobrasiliensis TaxID=45979 RepID=A0A370IC18_9NOCA|nr:SRPBCC family protein [Nocardia pseudobrasiliensis]RDI68150.1 polyketide cyclase/dehydrase/lipid transport protein [Nocardia pseudobrasiliensis]
MITIQIEEVCAAPVDYAFRYVADYRNTIHYLYGLSKFEPVTELDQGVGAVFDGSLGLGPVTLSCRMRAVDWDEPTLIRSKSVRGLDTEFTYRFAAVDAERSRVGLSIDLNFLGLAGRAMAKAVGPFIDSARKQTGTRLAEQVAAYYSAQRTA